LQAIDNFQQKLDLEKTKGNCSPRGIVSLGAVLSVDCLFCGGPSQLTITEVTALPALVFCKRRLHSLRWVSENAACRDVSS